MSIPTIYYYSSAKPSSGYSGAVRGYAIKLADSLVMEALAITDLAHLQTEIQHAPPAITIGMELLEGADACLQPYAPFQLKARPYADQWGQGASMHDLRKTDLLAAKKTAQQQWPSLYAPYLLLAIGNPNFLITEQDVWIDNILTLLAHQHTPGTLLITSSPRTNPLIADAFSNALEEAIPSTWRHHCYCFHHDNGQDNPYVPMLSIADAVIILGTSRTMAAQALMTGAPIYYVGDDDTATEQIKDTFPHFVPLTWDAAIPNQSFTPCDTTAPYVEQAVKDYQAHHSPAIRHAN